MSEETTEVTIDSTESIVSRLDAYEGDDIWGDVIETINGYNPNYTKELDPCNRRDIFGLENGNIIRYVEVMKGWQAAWQH